MRSMSTFEGPLVAFRNVVQEDRDRQIVRREEFRKRYDEAVARHTTQLKEQSGYKLGPMMNDQVIRRHFASLMGVVIERQLLVLVTPMLLTAQAIERSLHHVTIFASPSGHGRDRYAPKPRGTMPRQIKVGGACAPNEGRYAD